MKKFAAIFILSCLSLCLAKSIVDIPGDDQPTHVWGDVSGVDIDLTETKTIYIDPDLDSGKVFLLNYPEVSNTLIFLDNNISTTI